MVKNAKGFADLMCESHRETLTALRGLCEEMKAGMKAKMIKVVLEWRVCCVVHNSSWDGCSLVFAGDQCNVHWVFMEYSKQGVNHGHRLRESTHPSFSIQQGFMMILIMMAILRTHHYHNHGNNNYDHPIQYAISSTMVTTTTSTTTIIITTTHFLSTNNPITLPTLRLRISLQVNRNVQLHRQRCLQSPAKKRTHRILLFFLLRKRRQRM